MLNLRNYEKATKFGKNFPLVLTKQLFLLSSVKTNVKCFQIFVAFSEKLNFMPLVELSLSCTRTLKVLGSFFLRVVASKLQVRFNFVTDIG